MLWYLAVHRVSHSMGTFGTILYLLGFSLEKKLDNGLDCNNRIADLYNGIEIVHHQAKSVGCSVDKNSSGTALGLSLYLACT